MNCYVCGKPATGRVAVSHIDGRTTRYNACDTHEPRHIPGGDVVSIRVESIR